MRVKHIALTQPSWQGWMPLLHQWPCLASPSFDVVLKVELGNIGDYFSPMAACIIIGELSRCIPDWYIFKQSYGNLLRSFLKYVHIHNFKKEYKFNFFIMYIHYTWYCFIWGLFLKVQIAHWAHFFYTFLPSLFSSLPPISLLRFPRTSALMSYMSIYIYMILCSYIKIYEPHERKHIACFYLKLV